METGNAMPEAKASRKGPRFLRRRGLLFALLALPFVGSVAGAVVLSVIYHWPHVSVPTYYFIVRPPFVWFGMVAPFMAFGLVAVRWRWFAAGCMLWLVAFLATQEALPYLKPFGGRARERFWTAQMAFKSYLAVNPAPAGRINVPLRLVTWNVQGGGKGLGRAMGQLAGLDPDIVLMQEFGPGLLEGMPTALEKATQLRDYKVGRCGLAHGILSRWPVQELEDDVLPPDVGSAWRVDVAPGLSVVCLNVHLTPQPLRTQVLRGWRWDELADAVSHTRRELAAVNAALAFYARRGPVILAGDFNLPPRYPDLRRARGRFLDCFATNGYGWGQTVPAMLPAMRVDQIYVPPGSDVYYTAAVPTRWSDHYMTLTEVAIAVAAQPASSQAAAVREGPEKAHEP